MACKSCGGGRRRFKSGIPILDQSGNRISDNYEKHRRLHGTRPTRLRKVTPPKQATIKKNNYPNLITIPNSGTRINVLTYNPNEKCIFIVGYMEGCGSCNYMKRLINKIFTPELKSKIKCYILDKSFTENTGFQFTGNPTILFVNKGKLTFQVGGIFNKIDLKIADYIAE